MFTVVDQAGRTVQINTFPPKRIISLVPSQTELLHYLGLENEVVGITKFCVHPRGWFTSKTRVGGTKAVHINVIKALQPDIVLANKEENVKEQIEDISAIAPVWVSDINTLEDALQMTAAIGEITGKVNQAIDLVAEIRKRFAGLVLTPMTLIQQTNIPVAYLIWREPYMTVGGDTFINDMLQRAGFKNVFAHEKRYPQVTLDQIARSGCRYIFLSSEPFPFKPKHAEEIQKAIAGSNIVFVDGEMFSWYGSRLLLAAQYIQELKERLSANGNTANYT